MVTKPSFEVLSMVVSAYAAMGEEENALSAIAEALPALPEKKKPLANLLKVSLLFAQNKIGEAEALFSEVQNEKTDLPAQNLINAICKSDRATALGDYPTVENYMKQILLTKFPKPTNLALLCGHFNIAEACKKTDRPDEAKPHYEYCLENGKETVFRRNAEACLAALSAS